MTVPPTESDAGLDEGVTLSVRELLRHVRVARRGDLERAGCRARPHSKWRARSPQSSCSSSPAARAARPAGGRPRRGVRRSPSRALGEGSAGDPAAEDAASLAWSCAPTQVRFGLQWVLCAQPIAHEDGGFGVAVRAQMRTSEGAPRGIDGDPDDPFNFVWRRESPVDGRGGGSGMW